MTKPNPSDLSDLSEDALLTTAEVAQLLRLSPGRLRNLRCAGRGPRGFKIGRSVRFRLGAVRAWLAEKADPAPTSKAPIANA